LILKILSNFKNLFNRDVKKNSDTYIDFLKHKGVKVGTNVKFNQLDNVTIDVSRPSLVEIGDNVRITRGFTLLTHDFSWFVLRNKYNEIFSSSGPVKIGNNVFIGFNVTILPNVTIGNNCIIGTSSIVTKNVPDNSIVAGSPARIISTIDRFYKNRKGKCVEEAFVYANSIEERFGRKPTVDDFKEEFYLFTDRDNLGLVPEDYVKKQLSDTYENFIALHQKKFLNIEEFIENARKYKKDSLR